MAIIKLDPPRWAYDSVAKTINLLFVEPMPDGTSDPADWRPVNDYLLSLPISGNVSKIAHIPIDPDILPVDPIILPPPDIKPSTSDIITPDTLQQG